MNAGDPANLTSELADLQQQLEKKSLRIAELETQLHDSSAQPKSQEKEIRRLRQKIDELTSDPETPGAKGAQAKRVCDLEKALLAAAVDSLSYDPRSSKSDVPQQIVKTPQRDRYSGGLMAHLLAAAGTPPIIHVQCIE